MHNRLYGLAAALAMVCTPALAQFETYEFAKNLALVIGSEDLCGLTYNQPAIEALIADNVPASDMDFGGHLEMNLELVAMEKPTGSALTARCAQVKRVAKSYGLID